MAIKSDSSGFLIGERRLKEISEGINQTEDNTKQILTVLSDSFKEMQTVYSASSTQVRDLISRQNRSGQSQDASAPIKTARTVRKTVDAAEQAVDITQQALLAAKRLHKKAVDAETIDSDLVSKPPSVSSTKERAEKARERGANGRFIGKDGESSDKKSLFSRAKSFFGIGGGNGGGIGGDVEGIDPTLDALKELNEAVTPVKNVFKGMSARAVGIIRGRMKKRRADIVLPEEQVKANKETAKTDKKHTKLFESILSVLRSQNGGGILGGLGGLLGKGGKGGGLLALLGKGGKGLLKKIPFLGALVGGGLLAKDWGSLDSGGKGKGIGQIVGTAVGGMLGSFLGPVGTVAGGTLGNILGGIFGRKIGTWTDSLKNLDLGAVFKDFLKDKLGIGDGGGNKAFVPYANAGQASRLQRFKNWAGDKLGLSDSSDSTSAGDSGPSANGRFAPLLDLIAKGEARNGAFGTSGYDAVYSGAPIRPPKPISQMTFGEVKAYQKQLIKAGSKSTAAGRYQNIWNKGAFAEMAAQAGFKDSDIYNAENQDKLAIHYAGGKKQLDKWIKDGNYKAITNKTAQQWASMKNTNGVGNYDGDGLNRARHGGLQEITKVSEQIRQNAVEQVKPVQPVAPVKPKQQLPAAKGKPKEALIFPKGATRPAPIKVPTITPALAKIGSNTTAKAVSATPSDSGISQTVADRSLAHIFSGGLGYNSNNI